ncbi:MAG TPA: hypothetical protein VMR19_03780 [Candidatus Saccharimonadales bacterium]|jgi:hypothetical protein|nr:hypothetical protein [Candidatus Saccharimonadales bacterium]
MALERWINEQEKKGNLEAGQSGKVLLEKFGDVPLIDKTNFVAILKREIKEYKRDSKNPERVTAFWQAFWDKSGNKIDFVPGVTPCPLTEDQIVEAGRCGRGLIFVPENVATQESRYLLGKMFPKMHGNSVRMIDNEVRNIDSHFGWRLFDTQFEPLVPGAIESEVKTVMAAKSAEAPTLNEYIIASQAIKNLTGKYLDEERYFARLLGSALAGETIVARITQNGELDVFPWGPNQYASRVGARFSWPVKTL